MFFTISFLKINYFTSDLSKLTMTNIILQQLGSDMEGTLYMHMIVDNVNSWPSDAIQ